MISEIVEIDSIGSTCNIDGYCESEWTNDDDDNDQEEDEETK